MLGTGQDGGECCGKAIGEVNPSVHWEKHLVKINGCCCLLYELLWPSGYELQLSLKRLQVLILVKVIGG